MRSAVCEEGKRLLPISDSLSCQQILSFFTRLTNYEIPKQLTTSAYNGRSEHGRRVSKLCHASRRILVSTEAASSHNVRAAKCVCIGNQQQIRMAKAERRLTCPLKRKIEERKMVFVEAIE